MFQRIRKYLSELADVLVSNPQEGQVLTYRDGAWKNEAGVYTVSLTIDEMGFPIVDTSDTPAQLIAKDSTITAWNLVADASGGITIAVSKSTSPTGVTTALFSATLAGQQAASGQVNIAIAAGEWLRFVISGATAAVGKAKLTITLRG